MRQAEDHADDLEQRQPAPFQVADEQLHADVAAEALGVGDAEEHQERHHDLDDVDVAEDRHVEELAAQHVHDAEQHQREDAEAARPGP